MCFEGTIIITDPCYLIKDYDRFISENMIYRNTIYGDWGCTTYAVNNIDEFFKKINKGPSCRKIGEFTADSGNVCVCYLDEVLEFNPKFAKWALEHRDCVTVIPNYKGNVNFLVREEKYLHVVGEGNINFVTIQTSL